MARNKRTWFEELITIRDEGKKIKPIKKDYLSLDKISIYNIPECLRFLSGVFILNTEECSNRNTIFSNWWKRIYIFIVIRCDSDGNKDVTGAKLFFFLSFCFDIGT